MPDKDWKDKPCLWCALIVAVLGVWSLSACVYYALKVFRVI